jgi:hypothetical protein
MRCRSTLRKCISALLRPRGHHLRHYTRSLATLASDASNTTDSIANIFSSNSQGLESLLQRQHLRRRPHLLSLRFRDTRADTLRLRLDTDRVGGVRTVCDTIRTVFLNVHRRLETLRQLNKVNSHHKPVLQDTARYPETTAPSHRLPRAITQAGNTTTRTLS